MNDNRPIGVFDAGLGGLTVLRKIHEVLPWENLVYVGDTLRGPYEMQSVSTIEQYALQGILFLMEQNVKLIVLGTCRVSALVLESLNQKFHMPIIGLVEPSVKKAIEATRINNIGIIGQKITLASKTYEKILQQKQEGINLYSKACPALVSAAERKLNQGVAREQLINCLDYLSEKSIDTLILGSSYAVHLKSTIEEIIGPRITIVDPSTEASKVTARRLKIIGMENKVQEPSTPLVYMNDRSEEKQLLGEEFFGEPIESMPIDLDSFGWDAWGPQCGTIE